MLCFDYTINPQNLIKLVGAIIEKIEILIFFLCELPLILRRGQAQKYDPNIFGRGPYISNLNEIDDLVRPYLMRAQLAKSTLLTSTSVSLAFFRSLRVS